MAEVGARNSDAVSTRNEERRTPQKKLHLVREEASALRDPSPFFGGTRIWLAQAAKIKVLRDRVLERRLHAREDRNNGYASSADEDTASNSPAISALASNEYTFQGAGIIFTLDLDSCCGHGYITDSGGSLCFFLVVGRQRQGIKVGGFVLTFVPCDDPAKSELDFVVASNLEEEAAAASPPPPPLSSSSLSLTQGGDLRVSVFLDLETGTLAGREVQTNGQGVVFKRLPSSLLLSQRQSNPEVGSRLDAPTKTTTVVPPSARAPPPKCISTALGLARAAAKAERSAARAALSEAVAAAAVAAAASRANRANRGALASQPISAARAGTTTTTTIEAASATTLPLSWAEQLQLQRKQACEKAEALTLAMQWVLETTGAAAAATEMSVAGGCGGGSSSGAGGSSGGGNSGGEALDRRRFNSSDSVFSLDSSTGRSTHSKTPPHFGREGLLRRGESASGVSGVGGDGDASTAAEDACALREARTVLVATLQEAVPSDCTCRPGSRGGGCSGGGDRLGACVGKEPAGGGGDVGVDQRQNKVKGGVETGLEASPAPGERWCECGGGGVDLGWREKRALLELKPFILGRGAVKGVGSPSPSQPPVAFSLPPPLAPAPSTPSSSVKSGREVSRRRSRERPSPSPPLSSSPPPNNPNTTTATNDVTAPGKRRRRRSSRQQLVGEGFTDSWEAGAPLSSWLDAKGKCLATTLRRLPRLPLPAPPPPPPPPFLRHANITTDTTSTAPAPAAPSPNPPAPLPPPLTPLLRRREDGDGVNNRGQLNESEAIRGGSGEDGGSGSVRRTLLRRHEELEKGVQQPRREGGGSGMPHWREPPLSDSIAVRSKTYLADKLKVPSPAPFFPLLGLDLFNCVPKHKGGNGPRFNLSQHSASLAQRCLRGDAPHAVDPLLANLLSPLKNQDLPEAPLPGSGDVPTSAGAAAAASGLTTPIPDQHILCFNFILPFGNFAAYFVRPPAPSPASLATPASTTSTTSTSTTSDPLPAQPPARWSSPERGMCNGRPCANSNEGCDESLRAFYDAFVSAEDDADRKKRLKMLSRVSDGPWLVRKAVGKGKRPARLGDHIELSYFRSEKCFEVNINVARSSLGNSILGVIRPVAARVEVDLAFILEGLSHEELPERVLAAVRIEYPNIDAAPLLPPHDHTLLPTPPSSSPSSSFSLCGREQEAPPEKAQTEPDNLPSNSSSSTFLVDNGKRPLFEESSVGGNGAGSLSSSSSSASSRASSSAVNDEDEEESGAYDDSDGVVGGGCEECVRALDLSGAQLACCVEDVVSVVARLRGLRSLDLRGNERVAGDVPSSLADSQAARVRLFLADSSPPPSSPSPPSSTLAHTGTDDQLLNGFPGGAAAGADGDAGKAAANGGVGKEDEEASASSSAEEQQPPAPVLSRAEERTEKRRVCLERQQEQRRLRQSRDSNAPPSRSARRVAAAKAAAAEEQAAAEKAANDAQLVTAAGLATACRVAKVWRAVLAGLALKAEEEGDSVLGAQASEALSLVERADEENGRRLQQQQKHRQKQQRHRLAASAALLQTGDGTGEGAGNVGESSSSPSATSTKSLSATSPPSHALASHADDAASKQARPARQKPSHARRRSEPGQSKNNKGQPCSGKSPTSIPRTLP